MSNANELHKELLDRLDRASDADLVRMMVLSASSFKLGGTANGGGYSFGNLFLIAMQDGEATHVRGAKQWEQVGRKVRDDVQRVDILAPIFRACDHGDDDVDDCRCGGTGKLLRGWRGVQVVDVRHTDVVDAAAWEASQEPEPEAWEALTRAADALGVVVERGVTGAEAGFYSSAADAPRIVVSSRLTGAAACQTLAHELAHAVLHADVSRITDRAEAEIEAESCGWIVAAALGVADDVKTLGYLTGWAGRARADVQRVGKRVQVAANAILAATRAAEEAAEEAA